MLPPNKDVTSLDWNVCFFTYFIKNVYINEFLKKIGEKNLKWVKRIELENQRMKLRHYIRFINISNK